MQCLKFQLIQCYTCFQYIVMETQLERDAKIQNNQAKMSIIIKLVHVNPYESVHQLTQ